MEDPSNDQDLILSKSKRVFILLSLFLIMLGLILTFITPIQRNLVIPNAVWVIVGGLGLLILVYLVRIPVWVNRLFDRIPISGKTPWISSAVGFSLLSVISLLSFDNAIRSNYIPITTFWLLSAFCYVAAFISGQKLLVKGRSQLLAWLRFHRTELIILTAIIILGFGLRFYKLGEIPFVINGDEGWLGTVALDADTGTLVNPFAFWENFGAFYVQSISVCIHLFGTTAFALRLLPALGGVLAIPALYLLARQIGGNRVAMISAGVMAISHSHIHFSRTAAVAYIQGTWLVPLELFFLLRAIEKKSMWNAALGGVILGIHFSIYLSAQIVAALVLVYLVISALIFRHWIKNILTQGLVFFGGVIVVVLPQIVFILQKPDEFMNRLNLDGTFQSGWLERTMQDTGQSAIIILAQRVAHAFLSLIYYPTIDFYGSQVPVMSLLLSTLFLVGLGLIFLKARSPGFLLINGYFWSFTLAVGIFAVPPSADSYRMLAALPSAVIIAALGLDWLLKILGFGSETAREKYTVVVSIFLWSLLTYNLWTYFVDFAGRCKYGGDTQTRFSSHLGNYLKDYRREVPVTLLGSEQIFYGQNKSVDYLGNGQKITNVREPVDTVQLVKGMLIVAIPERINELQTWTKQYSGGKFQVEYDCDNPILAAYYLP